MRVGFKSGRIVVLTFILIVAAFYVGRYSGECQAEVSQKEEELPSINVLEPAEVVKVEKSELVLFLDFLNLMQKEINEPGSTDLFLYESARKDFENILKENVRILCINNLRERLVVKNESGNDYEKICKIEFTGTQEKRWNLNTLFYCNLNTGKILFSKSTRTNRGEEEDEYPEKNTILKNLEVLSYSLNKYANNEDGAFYVKNKMPDSVVLYRGLEYINGYNSASSFLDRIVPGKALFVIKWGPKKESGVVGEKTVILPIHAGQGYSVTSGDGFYWDIKNNMQMIIN